MKSVTTTLRHGLTIVLMLAAMTAAKQTLAGGTASGTVVSNRATIQYDVAAITQPIIESSPTGNSTPGAGAGGDTTFVVDNKVDLTVAEINSAATPVNPGQAAAVTAFTVTNTGNTAQGYALTAANLTSADAAVHGNADTDLDGNNLRVRVDANGNGTYDPANDTAAVIDTLAPDASVTVFVLIDVPIGATNLDVANVRLTAVTHTAGTNATSPTVETAGADDPNVVDVVFADANGNDGLEFDDDGYIVSSADLNISKTSTVISDPFNGTTNPKAIPGAVIEYAITIVNTGAVDAANVLVTDVLSGDVTLQTGQYNGNASDIQIEIGNVPALQYCVADNADLDGDGCGLSGGTLEVNPTAGLTVGTTAADDTVRVLFRATIN